MRLRKQKVVQRDLRLGILKLDRCHPKISQLFKGHASRQTGGSFWALLNELSAWCWLLAALHKTTCWRAL